jgi:hypothetical protein
MILLFAFLTVLTVLEPSLAHAAAARGATRQHAHAGGDHQRDRENGVDACIVIVSDDRDELDRRFSILADLIASCGCALAWEQPSATRHGRLRGHEHSVHRARMPRALSDHSARARPATRCLPVTCVIGPLSVGI